MEVIAPILFGGCHLNQLASSLGGKRGLEALRLLAGGQGGKLG